MERAPYASDPALSRGRLIDEPASPTRTAYQRDRDRIIHSTAFRRMKFKTQVFLAHEGDHYRTRLTHSLEVAQIARSMARVLKVDEDLTEAIALSHDFGHPPFGHAGERALDRVMLDHGGFDHNAQSLRVMTYLEKCYATFDGLNLSWETLEGIAKHNGPVLTSEDEDHSRLPHAMRVYTQKQDLKLHTHASLEAQLAAIADDIAYITHDVDDGIRAGYLSKEDLSVFPICRDVYAIVEETYGDLEDFRFKHETLRRVLTAMIEDVISTTQANVEAADCQSSDDVRAQPCLLACFSKEMGADAKALKSKLYERLYRHPMIMAIMGEAEEIIAQIYDAYWQDPSNLPDSVHEEMSDLPDDRRHRHLCDFIAGMTDRYALLEYGRLFRDKPRAQLSFSGS